MNASVLDVSDLRRSFDDLVAVDGVSFSVMAGETYGLLGPNGAGKTTTISMIAGLLEPSSGEVVVMGEPMTPKSFAAKRSIGLVPQELAIYPDLTGRENLRFFGGLYDLRGADLTSRTDEVLEMVALSDRADDRASEYSGGMKRRLNIAIGLLHRPELLILDEPTAGVDREGEESLIGLLARLKEEAALTILMVSHNVSLIRAHTDRILCLNRELLYSGPSRELTDPIIARAYHAHPEESAHD